MPELKAVTFDCYGTLIDWESGLAAFLYDLARRCGDDRPPSGEELRRRWEELQFDEIQGPYRSYRTVLSDSLRAWCGERGYHWNEREGIALQRSMECWQPFPDTVPALGALAAAGLRLAIISNSDHAIMEHTLRQIPEIEFDTVIVAEEARAYKPRTEPFTCALDALHLQAPEILHVAFGHRYDLATARQLGFGTVWVNRAREEFLPEGLEPDHIVSDLLGVPDAAGVPRPGP